ncbi:helix-turn-helix transcriptional regulator [Mesorhizobium sp. LNJC405B00]|uniref:helix-turn-helix domain-containing protein n=1 Tax=Mesorhizobium sp. LNJC405B00 TaxID=1287281 RepID=UPI0003CF7EE4|nr:helix-turn-helix transcriptional regulator [Mesorhizobium sp. LNJC405B00]ESX82765.1 XRE family transcriptional regulator [Mesorhizobium sp. LNJC405B00]
MMEMLISRDSLRRKIESDPDTDHDAGWPLEAIDNIGMFLPSELVSDAGNVVEMKHAFGVFIRQLRRRDQLSVETLGAKARVEAAEIRLIERDPNYKPRPRTVHQLAEFFRMPPRALMKLSGATVTRDEVLQEEAQKFAAKSDDLSKLSKHEQQVLDSFVKFLVLGQK